jgi:hypothetical protein
MPRGLSVPSPFICKGEGTVRVFDEIILALGLTRHILAQRHQLIFRLSHYPPNSSSSALASFRSAVSKPSVNQL